MNIKDSYYKSKNLILNNKVVSRTITNSGWLVGNRVFSMAIGVVIAAMVARYFGPDKYGQFNYAFSFVSLFTVMSTLGLETLTVKSIVDKDYDEGTILCTCLFLRIFGGILLTILASTIIRLIEPNDHNLHVLVLIMSFVMVLRSMEVIEYWIQAYQKAKISSIIHMSTYAFIALIKILLVVNGGNLVQYAIIYVFNSIIIGLALIISYFKIRKDLSPWQFNINYARTILSKSWYLILSGLMITLYMRIDQIMLGYIMPNRFELGVYSAAVRVAEMWYFVPMAIITSFKPVIMNKKNDNEDSYIKSMQTLYNIIAWVSIGFSLIILLSSNLIINILYGGEYQKSAQILSISVWAGTFAMLGSARSIWLISEGLQKYTLIYTSLGFLVNISLNYFMIPLLGGYGAAIATLVSQFTANVISLYFFEETRISSIMILKSLSPKGLLYLKYIFNK